jgi:hypothetical protein
MKLVRQTYSGRLPSDILNAKINRRVLCRRHLTKIAKKSSASLDGVMNWQGFANCATALISICLSMLIKAPAAGSLKRI